MPSMTLAMGSRTMWMPASPLCTPHTMTSLQIGESTMPCRSTDALKSERYTSQHDAAAWGCSGR